MGALGKCRPCAYRRDTGSSAAEYGAYVNARSIVDQPSHARPNLHTMMQRLTPLLAALPIAPSPISAAAQKPEALWYATNREESVQSFLAHADLISIVAPQVFSMDSAGLIWGSVDPR